MSKPIIKKYIGIVVENKVKLSSDDECWTICLKHLPAFTLKISTCIVCRMKKDKNIVISKTLERRIKFKNEDYYG